MRPLSTPKDNTPGAAATLRHPAGLIATFFGVGLLPVAPGTWGSLAALPVAWVIMVYAGPLALLSASAALLALGIWAAARVEAALGRSDPGRIVADEVVGQWLAVAAIPPDPVTYAIAFFLFRAADIAKPWPASWCDSELKGGLGVMLDDVVAGLYVCPLVALAAWLLGVWW